LVDANAHVETRVGSEAGGDGRGASCPSASDPRARCVVS